MAFSEDKDWDFLDRTIALTGDIINQANAIKDLSDDPDVLLEALKIEAEALIIQKSTRDYRSRLRSLKQWEKEAGPAAPRLRQKHPKEKELA